MQNRNNIAIAIGGNIGNVFRTFQKAIVLLRENGVEDILVSSTYSTPPENCIPGTPEFSNAMLIGKWNKSPQELLILCQNIESTLGRPKEHTSDVSRIIDLDIILFGNKIIDKPDLQIPHKKAHKRLFVLIPLAEIAPEWIFPNKQATVKELLKKLEAQ